MLHLHLRLQSNITPKSLHAAYCIMHLVSASESERHDHCQTEFMNSNSGDTAELTQSQSECGFESENKSEQRI